MSELDNRSVEELQAELALVREQLAAERAVNSSLNACLDESLEVIAASDETLHTQRAVIDGLKLTLTEYQHILDGQVRPLCEAALALCGGRQEQQRFVLDEQ